MLKTGVSNYDQAAMQAFLQNQAVRAVALNKREGECRWPKRKNNNDDDDEWGNVEPRIRTRVLNMIFEKNNFN